MTINSSESTVMSILRGVTAEQSSLQRTYLERFCNTYSQPLVDFLVIAKRVTENDAHDIVQDFWLSKMLEQPPNANLVAKYLVARESYKGSSFRRYLSHSLTNFYRSKYRSADATARREQVSIEVLEGWEPDELDDIPEFDLIWANHLLANVLERVREEFATKALTLKWQVFTKLILQPCAMNQSRPSYAEVASELGLKTPKEIDTALRMFKRIFVRHFNLSVRDYLPARSEEESVTNAEAEVKAVLLHLSKAGRLVLPLKQWGIAADDTDSTLGLALENLGTRQLVQSDADYRAVWTSVLETNLLTTLDMRSIEETPIMVADILNGSLTDIVVLDRIRNRVKQLGSSTAVVSESTVLLPERVYGLIYLIVLAAAKLYQQTEISSQPGRKTISNASRFATEEWIDNETKIFLNRFLSSVEDPNNF